VTARERRENGGGDPQRMTVLLGIDCATQPRKTGLALGELNDGRVCILRCATASNSRPPALVAEEWLQGCDEVLIALDAPLGWPHALGEELSIHQAGMPLAERADRLFARETDRAIAERLGKRPLEVGANLIARTAVAALALLEQLGQMTERTIPLAWSPRDRGPWSAIEVYPAATRIAHEAPDHGGSLEGLEALLDCSGVSLAVLACADAADACVCALAAADFLLERAVPPTDLEVARREGWIWASARPSVSPSQVIGEWSRPS